MRKSGEEMGKNIENVEEMGEKRQEKDASCNSLIEEKIICHKKYVKMRLDKKQYERLTFLHSTDSNCSNSLKSKTQRDFLTRQR